MKRVRLDRWAAVQIQPPRNPRLHSQRCAFSSSEPRAAPTLLQSQSQQRDERIQQIQQHQWQPVRRHVTSRRRESTVVRFEPEDALRAATEEGGQVKAAPAPSTPTPLYAPHHRRALHSAKLSALHARLSLPSKLPLQTLARCLIDPSADPRASFNNTSLSILGQDLLGYYTTEHLMCHHPRLPMPVLFAAQYAYVGNATLAAIRAEWGVDVVAAPGKEVDPGLLQLKRTVAGNSMVEGDVEGRRVKDLSIRAGKLGSGRRNEEQNYRRGMSSRIVFDDQFGDLQTDLPPADASPYPGAAISTSSSAEGQQEVTPTAFSNDRALTADDTDPTTVEAASATFIRALAGALYLHAGSAASKAFHRDHVLSRQLPLHSLFHFTHPTRDLSRLCARENFEPPVARLLSETGRLSRTPVFVVGVFSGGDKLGEGAGSSLNEARVRAAAAALRGWYLYSPPATEVVLPSEVEGAGAEKRVWKAQMVDQGEIVT